MSEQELYSCRFASRQGQTDGVLALVMKEAVAIMAKRQNVCRVIYKSMTSYIID